MWKIILVALSLVFFSSALPRAKNNGKCGYESCPTIKPDMLNVHFVSHTHDDVGKKRVKLVLKNFLTNKKFSGWLKTVDQYYYGSKGSIQKANVQAIIDSVIDALLQNSDRKFIYVESAFFTKWWNEQNEEMKDTVKMLVNEGRLEFVGGAWSMNDEAAAHYQSIVDQFTWGLKFLNETFGECGRPKIGWQIDPFGHSREQASIFTKMGYDGLFFSRLDLQDKANRIQEKNLEMIWKSSSTLGDSELFTGVLNNTWYNAPDLFCFDIVCSDEPIIDDKRSSDYNVDRRIKEFEKVLRIQHSYYKSNNIMLTFGGDFTYMAAGMYFKELDKLIKYTNERQNELKINAFYSTPSCYLNSLHKSDVNWPTKSDDFFPYASDPYSFWTGYYTSRPNSKGFERLGNRFLQVCKKLSAAVPEPEDFFDKNLSRLKGIMGVMQHHDAITGTEKQHVADDYHRELDAAITDCEQNTKSALKHFVTNNDDSLNFDFQFKSCINLNISLCAVTENSEKLLVTIYNPLSHVTNQHVRFPVSGNVYQVQDAAGTVVNSQIVPIPSTIKNLSYRTSPAQNELVFQAQNVPEMGYKVFYVSQVSSTGNSPIKSAEIIGPVSIGDDNFGVKFDENGLLTSITVDGEVSNLSQNFYIYIGNLNNDEIFANRSSGAYIFRPDPTEAVKPASTTAKLELFRGEHVYEIHQVFNDWISQVVRVYKTEKNIEFEWMVGPIFTDDGVGREIVSKFTSGIKSEGFFYTDSNGRQMLKRKRNSRETWDLKMQEPVAGNFYPINSKIAIEDETHRMAILNDRAQGASSMIDGTIELMVHRRLLKDDTFGVGEPLNETAYGEGVIARGKHWLVFGKKSSQNPTLQALERLKQNEVLMSNWLFFDDATNLSFDDWKKYKNEQSLTIGSELPKHIYLMTFEAWRNDSYLIRLEHTIDLNEDPELSKPVKLNLTAIFPGDYKFEEVSLSANQWIDDVKRLKFSENSQETAEKILDNEITLKPFEIRTIIMSVNFAGKLQVFCFFPVLVLLAVMKNFLKF